MLRSQEMLTSPDHHFRQTVVFLLLNVCWFVSGLEICLFSQTHIMVWIGGDIQRSSSFNCPDRAGTPSLDQVAPSPSNLALNASSNGGSTASLGSLFPCLTTSIVKKFHACIQPIPTCFQFKNIPPCSVSTGLSKKPPSTFITSHLYWLKGC